MDGREEGAANLKADWTSLRRRRALARAHNRPPDGGGRCAAAVVALLRVRAIGSDRSNKSIAPQSVPKEFQRPTVRASERVRPLEQSLKSGWAEEGETGGSDSNFGQRSMHAHEEECGASRKRRGAE